VSFRADVFAAAARLLAAGPVYFVVADARFATKLGMIFAGLVGAPGFHALVVGRDDLARIPREAPAYVTRAARQRMNDPALLAQVKPGSRVFAPESESELLTCIVRANMRALAARRG